MTNNISSIHPDILDNNRQEILERLLPFLKGFVLGGGTGLALQLAHRKSFDFFSQSEIPKQLLEKLSKNIEIANIVVDTPDELTFFTTDDIKVTLLHYPFKPHFEPLKLENGLLVYPIKEIAVQKAYTIGRRGEYRDYFDLYTILKTGDISLSDLIAITKQVYNGAFDEKMFLQQLVYFDDLQNFEIIPASQTSLPTQEDIKQFLDKLIDSYLSQIDL